MYAENGRRELETSETGSTRNQTENVEPVGEIHPPEEPCSGYVNCSKPSGETGLNGTLRFSANLPIKPISSELSPDYEIGSVDSCGTTPPKAKLYRTGMPLRHNAGLLQCPSTISPADPTTRQSIPLSTQVPSFPTSKLSARRLPPSSLVFPPFLPRPFRPFCPFPHPSWRLQRSRHSKDKGLQPLVRQCFPANSKYFSDS